MNGLSKKRYKDIDFPFAKEIWKFDEDKIKLIEKEGYEVLVIWETEYRNGTQQILQKCIEFINK